MPPPAKPIIIANFLRDLYYNPSLRNDYWDAINKPLDKFRQTALQKVFDKYRYDLTYKDFIDEGVAGWKFLTKQSLLAWNSIYRLIPVNPAVGPDSDQPGQIYNCMIAGSRTGAVSILWDNVNIIGINDQFKASLGISSISTHLTRAAVLLTG